MVKRRNTKRLEQFLNSRRQTPEATLEERWKLSGRVSRVLVGLAGVLFLVVVVRPPTGPGAVALAVLLGSLLGLGAACVLRIQPDRLRNAGRFNQVVLLFAAAVLVAKAMLLLRWPPYLVPLPLFAMVASMAFQQLVALLGGLGLAFFTAAISPTAPSLVPGAEFPRLDLQLAVVLSVGVVVSVLGVVRVRRQSRPVVVGFYAGLVQSLVLLCFRVLPESFSLSPLGGRSASELIESEEVTSFLADLFRDPGLSFCNGIICGGIVTSFLPAIERLFSVMTERRLLDLADPSNNLLRVLRERAPGTFQHTLGVQQLAHEASEAIAADALLADVGAYYHDIGKIYKPEYFVENMGEDKSIHSRLRPSMSKLIIISHVKDGIVLAKEEKLPQKIIDMIPMHHGTTVVEYFYHKSREQRGDDPARGGDEFEYRYPGPRPTFPEAGVLMLADAVEAIAKTLVDPTPNRLRDVVRGLVHKRLLDGQLDECNLTMADLKKIEDSFVKTLTNMYHSRIRYPAGPDSQKTEAEETGPAKLVEAVKGARVL
jgi:hypothetical protein